MMRANRIIQGDALQVLRTLPDESVDCCVTSPPYMNMRAYGTEPLDWPTMSYVPMPGLPGVNVPACRCELGNEKSMFQYVAHMVYVFREVRRVLSKKGTLFLNIADPYEGSRCGGGFSNRRDRAEGLYPEKPKSILKDKNLIPTAWMVAMSLEADGWWLRQDNVWYKANCTPDCVKDRTTKAHEYVFHFSKSKSYYYNAAAIAEPVTGNTHSRGRRHRTPKEADNNTNIKAKSSLYDSIWGSSGNKAREYGEDHERPGSHKGTSIPWNGTTRNMRSVWQINVEPYPGDHYATFPKELTRICIRSGCPPTGTVLDPFGGTGTVGQVALEENRGFLLVELNEKSVQQCHDRIYSNCRQLTDYEKEA